MLLLQAVGGVGQLVSLIVTPSSALTVVILIGLLAAWRLLAIADAMSIGDVKAPLRHRPTVLTFSALALGVLVMHGAFGYVAWAAYDATSRMFVGEGIAGRQPPTVARGRRVGRPRCRVPGLPDQHARDGDGRINILLTGIDAA